VDLLNEIMDWSHDPNGACIFWLNGMAGTGKSTIARTVARKWADDNRLGASFFFSRGQGDLGHASQFFTTLAYQLAHTLPALRSAMHKAINDNHDIAQQGLGEQWKHLILRPLSNLQKPEASLQLKSFVLVIDALDECEGEDDAGLIIQLFAQAKTLKTVRLRIFVTSRPETPIRLGFDDISKAEHQDFVLHGIPKLIIDSDISLFLYHELERIRKRRRLPSEWPGKPDIDLLVRRADGLFIYAATICRFIGDKDSYPKERLSFVLQESMEDGSPTEHLDLMYTKILRYAIVEGREKRKKERLLERFRRTVGSIVILSDTLIAGALAELLGTEKWEVEEILESLHAVLDDSKSQNSRIQLLHPSFRDFLLDHRRCKDVQFRIDGEEAHKGLFVNCLGLMSRYLKRDMCSLRLPGTFISEVESRAVEDCLPQEVQYACRSWVYHLQQSNTKLCDKQLLHDQVYTFLKEHLLHWLEALSLMEKICDGIVMIRTLESMLTVSDSGYYEVGIGFWEVAVYSRIVNFRCGKYSNKLEKEHSRIALSMI
jgi:hypothetical protein